MTNEQEQCPYCHQYKDDGYLYEDDISAITKNLYGKVQQVKWVGKNLSNYEAEYDDYNDSVCRVGRYDDGEIVCTNEEKYFLAIGGEMPLGTTYFPINCCPICGRDFNDTKKCVRITKMTDDIKELQELAKYYQNCAEYYHEKATRWRKQSDEDEAERERLIDIMCKIYDLTGHDLKETVDDLAEKLDQIKELTKKA